MIVAVCTVKGTLGATTTALVTAAAGATVVPAWLIEADPSGGVLAGLCRHLATSPGLERLTSNRDPFAFEYLDSVSQPLGAFRVAVAPADAFRATVAVSSPRSEWLSDLARMKGLVVVDIGRIGGGSPSWPILAFADMVIVVAAPTPLGLAGAVEWCEHGGRIAPGLTGVDPTVCRIATVHPPDKRRQQHFDPTDVRAQLGARLAACLPWDPNAVDLLLRGAEFGYPRLKGSPLCRAARGLLDVLALSQ